MTIKENILLYIKQHPGATDSDIKQYLNKRHQTINQACRQLQLEGHIIRQINPLKNNNIGNYFLEQRDITIISETHTKEAVTNTNKPLQEEEIKHILAEYLVNNGWDVKVAWGNMRGIDIDAQKDSKRWIIEVKGPASKHHAQKNNYFLSILGEILQRMNDINARYSIALPDIPKYRRLWNELPELAKDRIAVDLILVDENSNIIFEINDYS